MLELRVGACLVRPETGEVIRGQKVIHLEPKSMSLLAYLIAHPGKVTSRDELLDEIWPGVHVGDDSLTAVIIKLRRALGDDARNPRYIETIPKRGYRLVADVRPFAGPASSAQPLAERTWRRSIVPVGALLIALLGIIAWGWAGLFPKGAENTVRRNGDQPFIAVADFENASGDPAQQYLAHGIGETILTDLAQVSNLTVGHLNAPQTGGGRPDYVLEGSVLRQSNVIRINVRLLGGDEGDVISVLRYDRPFADLLTIEDEIRDTVLVKLERTISEAEKSRLARGYTDNVLAYDLFLQAQRDLLVRTRETNAAARKLYRQAIELDPAFARAYGGLALTYAAEYRNNWVEDDSDVLEAAVRYAETALGISPNLPEQYWVIGYVRTQQRRYDEALEELQAAIALDPGYADAFALSGGIETYRQNFHASVPLLREAMRLNPSAGHLYFLLLARAYYFMDDFEQAEINLNEALARNPENIETHLYLAATLVHLGRNEDAAWEAMEVLNIAPDFNLKRWNATYPMANGAQLDHLNSDLRQAGLS